ncbi:MAG: thioredoxin-dependent thiol peroxidase [Bacteroidota bacterium]
MADKKHSTSLKPGDKAPDFKGIDQNEKKVSLKDFKGKKLILYFYPKDNTPGCTMQGCNLRDNFSSLKNKGFEVVGVSADNLASHKKFAERFKLPYSLLADEEHKIIKAYDVWGKKSLFGVSFNGILRATFLISENGIIEEIIDNVKTNNHSAQIIEFYEKREKK